MAIDWCLSRGRCSSGGAPAPSLLALQHQSHHLMAPAHSSAVSPTPPCDNYPTLVEIVFLVYRQECYFIPRVHCVPATHSLGSLLKSSTSTSHLLCSCKASKQPVDPAASKPPSPSLPPLTVNYFSHNPNHCNQPPFSPSTRQRGMQPKKPPPPRDTFSQLP